MSPNGIGVVSIGHRLRETFGQKEAAAFTPDTNLGEAPAALLTPILPLELVSLAASLYFECAKLILVF